MIPSSAVAATAMTAALLVMALPARSEKAFLLADAATGSMMEKLPDHQSDQQWQLELAWLRAVGAQAAINTGNDSAADELSRSCPETIDGVIEVSPQPAHILSLLIEARTIRSDVLLVMDYKNEAEPLGLHPLQ